MFEEIVGSSKTHAPPAETGGEGRTGRLDSPHSR
jgi:hypothetical protein